MRRWGANTLDETLGSILFFSLCGAAAVAFSCYVRSGHGLLYGKARGDFLLMTVQSALGVAGAMMLAWIARKCAWQLPRHLLSFLYVFLFCAVFLGEMLSFYYLIPWWDLFLHGFSGAMLAYLGFHLAYGPISRHGMKAASLTAAAFAFCFSLALGGLWEGYEYLMDGALNMNMQKFADAQGNAFPGRMALRDTMEDILIDAGASLISAMVLWRRHLTGNV